jgi:hypothetical protein
LPEIEQPQPASGRKTTKTHAPFTPAAATRCCPHQCVERVLQTRWHDCVRCQLCDRRFAPTRCAIGIFGADDCFPRQFVQHRPIGHAPVSFTASRQKIFATSYYQVRRAELPGVAMAPAFGVELAMSVSYSAETAEPRARPCAGADSDRVESHFRTHRIYSMYVTRDPEHHT